MAKDEKKKLSILKNPQRRNFLKNALLVGAGFAAGRLLNNLPFSKKETTDLERLLKKYDQAETAVFENFVVQETDKELNFFTRDGEKIFVLEKD